MNREAEDEISSCIPERISGMRITTELIITATQHLFCSWSEDPFFAESLRDSVTEDGQHAGAADREYV
jgi:hypothetical protein